MEAADLMENEKVQIVNNNNGARLETYVIQGHAAAALFVLTAQLHGWYSLEITSLSFLMP